MKLKTLQENPALFLDVRDLVVELAKYYPVPEAPPSLKAGLGELMESARAIKEKWEQLENPSERKLDLPQVP